MGQYLDNLPMKKVEPLELDGAKFIGSQNIFGFSNLDISIFSEEYLKNLKSNNQYLICCLENGEWDAAAILDSMYEIKRFTDISDDNRARYYFIISQEQYDKFK